MAATRPLDPCFERTACTLGRLWKRSRRSLPSDVATSFAGLLHQIAPYFNVNPAADVPTNLSGARQSVAGFVDLLVPLATSAVSATSSGASSMCGPSCSPFVDRPLPIDANAIDVSVLESFRAELFHGMDELFATHTVSDAVGSEMAEFRAIQPASGVDINFDDFTFTLAGSDLDGDPTESSCPSLAPTPCTSDGEDQVLCVHTRGGLPPGGAPRTGQPGWTLLTSSPFIPAQYRVDNPFSANAYIPVVSRPCVSQHIWWAAWARIYSIWLAPGMSGSTSVGGTPLRALGDERGVTPYGSRLFSSDDSSESGSFGNLVAASVVGFRRGRHVSFTT